MVWLEKLKQRAHHLKAETIALYFAARHPGTPWFAKWVTAAVVAYALSPIDLIPDFIPVLGYLDDLVVLPLGIALAVLLIPASIMAESRKKALKRLSEKKPVSFAGGAAIALIWLAMAALSARWLYGVFMAAM